MPRRIEREDLAYDSIASPWHEFVDSYDTNRRIEVLVHDFLGAEKLQGKTCLEGGCGLGDFSMEMLKFGPERIVGLDVAPGARQCSGPGGSAAQGLRQLRTEARRVNQAAVRVETGHEALRVPPEAGLHLVPQAWRRTPFPSTQRPQAPT